MRRAFHLVFSATAIVLLATWTLAFNRQLTLFTSSLSFFPTETLTSGESESNIQPLHHIISLPTLVDTDRETACAPPLVRVNDTLSAEFHIDYKSHRIPKIVHVTARSRCMTQVFADNLDRWRFDGWSFFIHDDEAMNQLLNQYWPMFPQVSESVKCMLSTTAKSDLWRALVLWEYGGVYTDIDNSPNKFNGTFLTNEDSLFVVEMIGVLSQYFMAASPRHPLMHQLVLSVMHSLYDLQDLSKQYAPFTTGPGALKRAFTHFMHVPSTWVLGIHKNIQNGTYVGLGNRSVTVVGRKDKSQEYVMRERIHGNDKADGYQAMGMTHFNVAEKNVTVGNASCFNHLFDQIDWSRYYTT